MSSENISPLHKAAREFAAAGIPVFPCRVHGKEPVTASGFKDATTDIQTIDRWWREDPNYNLAASPEHAGWAVVDIDNPDIELPESEYVPTYTVTTPRGGRHLYYAGSLPSTTSKLAAKIDTRGVGGYVLLPPSHVIDPKKGIDGSYKVLHEREIAPLPAWIGPRLAEGNIEVGAAVEELDTGANVARATSLLLDLVKRGDFAIEGRGGNDRTYRLSCELLNLGLSPDKARELLIEHWNPHCVPPWSDDELGVITENASHYSQNEAGAWAVAPAAETFAPATLDKLARDSVSSQPERRSRFHPEDEDEQEEGEDPSWILPGLLPERSTVLLVGRSGSLKSFLALEWLLASSAQQTTHGDVPLAGANFYAANEGRHNIKKARRRAWKIARDVTKVPDFYVMNAPVIAIDGEMQEFGEQIQKKCGKSKPRMIVLDTTAKCMAGLNENDAGDAGKFIRFADSLVEAFDCTVIAIHHTGKDDSRGARGSSAFQAGFDTVLEVITDKKTKAVAVHVRKHKDAEEAEAPWTFEARVIGPSLVLFPTTMAEHMSLTAKDDLYEPKKVGAALARLKAYGQANAVTTHVLAGDLSPVIEGEDAEAHERRKERAARTLGSLAKSKLLGYAVREGQSLRWYLPAQ